MIMKTNCNYCAAFWASSLQIRLQNRVSGPRCSTCGRSARSASAQLLFLAQATAHKWDLLIKKRGRITRKCSCTMVCVCVCVCLCVWIKVNYRLFHLSFPLQLQSAANTADEHPTMEVTSAARCCSQVGQQEWRCYRLFNSRRKKLAWVFLRHRAANDSLRQKLCIFSTLVD